MSKLRQTLYGIHYDNSDCFNESKLVERIEKEMPDYDIEVWDADEHNTSLCACIVDYILDVVDEKQKQGKKIEIEYDEWCTDNTDAYFMVVAVKK